MPLEPRVITAHYELSDGTVQPGDIFKFYPRTPTYDETTHYALSLVTGVIDDEGDLKASDGDSDLKLIPATGYLAAHPDGNTQYEFYLVEDEDPIDLVVLRELGMSMAPTEPGYVVLESKIAEHAAIEEAAREDGDAANSAALAAHVATKASAGTLGHVRIGTGLSIDGDGILSATVDVSPYAPLASPAFTGTPTAPTAAPGTNTTQLSTTAFVQAAIDALINVAPSALDTLDELAAALGDDANFAGTVTTALAGKLTAASNLSDIPTPATARTNLGLGTANSPTFAGLTLSGALLAPDGLVGSPGFSFSGQSTTGFWRSGSSRIGVTLSGVNQFSFFDTNFRLASANAIGWSSTSNPDSTPDVLLLRDAANVLSMRNGANAQALRLYNTFTDASNYERGGLSWSASQLFFITENAGTGSARNLALQSASAIRFYSGGNNERWQINSSGHLVAPVDNTCDIGASGASRPRDYYGGGNITAAGTVQGTVMQAPAAGSYRFSGRMIMTAPADGQVRITNAATTDFGLLQLGGGTSAFPALKRSAATLQVRLADDSAYAPLDASEHQTAGTKVVGARATGWTAATGTATRTTFATGSVTLPQLAERVKALLDDLIAHGLIGA